MHRRRSYFPLVVKWQDILLKFIVIWAFFQEMDTIIQNRYPLVLLQLHFINTTILERFFWILIENHWQIEICYFWKVKKSKLVITIWKLPKSKVYHGLNNALAYAYMKNTTTFCPPRWYRYVKIWVLAHGLSCIFWLKTPHGLQTVPSTDLYLFYIWIRLEVIEKTGHLLQFVSANSCHNCIDIRLQNISD